LVDRHAAAVGQPVRGGARLAVHEVLADERLRSHLAARVFAQVGQPRLRDLGLDDGERPGLALEAHLAGLAGAHTGDLEVAALGQAEGVVEHDLIGPGVVVGAGSRAQPEHCRDARGHDGDDRARALHGPTDLWLGSQSSAAASSAVSTLLPSAAGASLAPGQRRNWSVFGPGP
jgi:hypothetical protein